MKELIIENFEEIKPFRISKSILKEVESNIRYAKDGEGKRIYKTFSLYVRSAIIRLNKHWNKQLIKRRGRPKNVSD